MGRKNSIFQLAEEVYGPARKKQSTTRSPKRKRANPPKASAMSQPVSQKRNHGSTHKKGNTVIKRFVDEGKEVILEYQEVNRPPVHLEEDAPLTEAQSVVAEEMSTVDDPFEDQGDQDWTQAQSIDPPIEDLPYEEVAGSTQGETAPAEAMSDNFEADLMAILSGQKQYDPEAGAAKGWDELSQRKQEQPRSPKTGKKGTPTSRSHSIFDQMSSGMQHIDLGTINVDRRFEEFERKMSVEEAEQGKAKENASTSPQETPTPQSPKSPPQSEAMMHIDMVEDLTAMGMSFDDASGVVAEAMGKGLSKKGQQMQAKLQAEKEAAAKAHMDQLWVHISQGGYPGQVNDASGFHSTIYEGRQQEPKPRFIRLGEPTVADQFGVYQQEVKHLKSGTKKISTFFPDAWNSKDHFKDMFLNISQIKGGKDNLYEITGSIQGSDAYKGMMIAFKGGAGGTVYPVMEAVAEAQSISEAMGKGNNPASEKKTKELLEKAFGKQAVNHAGNTTAGADFHVHKPKKLIWIVEVKGKISWKNQKNYQLASGNHSPAKQVIHHFSGGKKTTMEQVLKEQQQMIERLNPPKLLLAAVNITDQDALIALVTKDEEGKEILQKDQCYPLTWREVTQFIKDAGKTQKALENLFDENAFLFAKGDPPTSKTYEDSIEMLRIGTNMPALNWQYEQKGAQNSDLLLTGEILYNALRQSTDHLTHKAVNDDSKTLRLQPVFHNLQGIKPPKE